MNILDKVKNLFFRTKAEPIKQTIPQASTPVIFSTIEESQHNKIELWGNNQDIMRGLKFSATLQLRTPLRVLLRDGEIHTDRKITPPEIAKAMWEGIWVLQTITLRELGIDIDEFPPSSQASEIGPILPAEYLPFLISIRTIVETYEPVETRIEKLIKMPLTTELADFAQKHGGMNELAERFFPHFISGIPRIPGSAKYALSGLGLNTPNKLAAASDEIVLSIRGIGPGKLQVIRDFCASIVEQRDSERLDNVYR